MVKMAYASLPKFVPIATSNMCPNNVAKTTLSEVLQSDQVRRLFNQPNIVIKAVPLTAAKTGEDFVSKDLFGKNRNGMNTNFNNIKPPEISIVPVRLSDEEREDANLLPSKIEDKKSEIALLPIKQKLCGHYEPCENIICDVAVQQYVDQDRISPILAVNIEEDEINAPVAKHCKNEYCDALSIDHNRCRRALIKLYRCDRSRMCDICKITLKGWKSRVHHRNCIRRDEYRHNNVDRVHLLKERMRERELQMLEAAKMNKNDYLDPIRGYNLAMETLRKNEELIIIPKTAPSQKPIITITSVPNTQSIGTNLFNANETVNASSQENIKNIVGNVSFALAMQNTTIRSGNASRLEGNRAQPTDRVRFPNTQQNSYGMTSTSVPASPFVPSQNQYVSRLATPPQAVQPITINNWIVSSSHGLIKTTPIQSKPFFTPIRVVPITNLITAPSLLHRMQGIPKFCIMAERVKPLAMPNPPPLQPAVAVDIAAQQERILKVPIQATMQSRCKSPKKFTKRPKKFFCIYCSKHFSTDWYFKMHVAKHKGEKLFFCNLCDESFSNRYDMRKHTSRKHDDREEFACDACDYVCKSPASFKSHVKTHATPSPDKTDDKSEESHIETVEYNPECFKGFSADKMNDHTMSVPDSNGFDMKKLKCEDTFDDTNENTEIFINGAKPESPEDICVEEHDSKELLNINGDGNAKMNEFTSVSITENIDANSFEQKAEISWR